MSLARAFNLEDVREAARRTLPRLIFDFIDGGVDDEIGLARNRAAFRRHALLPRYLVDVSSPDLSTEVFGQRYALPFGISPMGGCGVFRRGADGMMAAAAAEADIPFLLSTVSSEPLEAIAKIAPRHAWFQLYGSRDSAITLGMVRRARDAGIRQLVLSVDVPVMSNRERNRRNGYSRPMRKTPQVAAQVLARPRWLLGYLRHGMPGLANFAPYVQAGSGLAADADLFDRNIPAPAQTWDLIGTLREQWPGTLVVKGLLHPGDAQLAVDAGADGVIVSNHGARQLDTAPASIEMLPAVDAAVGRRTSVMLDSGVRRGTDLVVARALGARFCFLGRPFLYGAVAGGTAGVAHAIQLLARELRLVLCQLGCSRFDDLGPSVLAATALSPRDLETGVAG